MFLCDNQEILSDFNTLALKEIFSKTQNVFKALGLKRHHFHTKLPYQEPVLRQIMVREYKMDLSQRTEFCQLLL